MPLERNDAIAIQATDTGRSVASCQSWQVMANEGVSGKSQFRVLEKGF
jgi:hypothetical protein